MLRIIDSALRHGYTEETLKKIWETVPEDTVVRVRHDRMPPHYMMLGTAPTGETVELIAFTDGFDWFLFHAMPAASGSFAREYKMNGGRL